MKKESVEIWEKIRESKIRHPKLKSQKDVEKLIKARELDKNFRKLPDKQQFEIRIGKEISDTTWEAIVNMDEKHGLKELKTMCRKITLPVSGDKKELALNILKKEFEKI